MISNMDICLHRALFIIFALCVSLSSAVDDCSDCEKLTYLCEFGQRGCVRDAEKCRSQCCTSLIDWISGGCSRCKGDCNREEDECIRECRAVVDKCHESCDIICCERQNKCFAKTGAFNGALWKLPHCGQPKYYLYRNDIEGNLQIHHGLTPPEYVKEDQTVFLVHGWRSSATSYWVLDAKDTFLSKENYNVITIDWSYAAGNLYYPQAASDIRVNAVDVAMMVDQLQPTFSWCIGESLGAHTCGLAGKSGAEWDRITGLDPAGPMFESGSCNDDPENCRLHPSDADQVEAIHTDGEESLDSYGTRVALGDMDFYPNGGDRQPGCNVMGLDTGCNHMIAAKYFIESILTDCFKSKETCSDYNNIPGSCVDCEAGECPNMGSSTAKKPGMFFLSTMASSPFCQD